MTEIIKNGKNEYVYTYNKKTFMYVLRVFYKILYCFINNIMR